MEFIFYYKFTTPPTPPAKEPPTAILETPEKVMAGEVVKADGSKSWSNNPGGYIADYYFEYEGANLEKDNGSDVRIWYPDTGTYEIYLEVEDENDLIGHIAYSLYKSNKIKYIEQYKEKNGGTTPKESDLEIFFIIFQEQQFLH